MSDRTFVIGDKLMEGEDVLNWQREIKQQFAAMNIDCPIVLDGKYGVTSRAYSASLLHAEGYAASELMKNGITPELRIKVRNSRRTKDEERRFADRVDYRRKLRDRYDRASVVDVHRPVKTILEDAWGYHPPGHDGLDVICQPNAVLFAMVKSRVIDVRTGDWWGKQPSGNTSLGDGIIQLEVLESVGPFKKGYHIGYGHSEKAVVREGQIVEAGDKLGHAGLAVAWHIHLMVNTGNTEKGTGNLDPRPFLDYAVKYG